MQSKMTTLSSSISLFEFNLVKTRRHQRIELFCFLIKDHFIYCKKKKTATIEISWNDFYNKVAFSIWFGIHKARFCP